MKGNRRFGGTHHLILKNEEHPNQETSLKKATSKTNAPFMMVC
jgi:hypothetical protein